MNAWKHLTTAGAICACLFVTSMAWADDNDRYDLVHTLKLETGEEFEMPLMFYTGYPDCYRAQKKVKVGTVIPRGTLMTANGKSPSATIIGARCVLKK